jgi:hypothetical protein
LLFLLLTGLLSPLLFEHLHLILMLSVGLSGSLSAAGVHLRSNASIGSGDHLGVGTEVSRWIHPRHLNRGITHLIAATSLNLRGWLGCLLGLVCLGLLFGDGVSPATLTLPHPLVNHGFLEGSSVFGPTGSHVLVHHPHGLFPVIAVHGRINAL